MAFKKGSGAKPPAGGSSSSGGNEPPDEPRPAEGEWQHPVQHVPTSVIRAETNDMVNIAMRPDQKRTPAIIKAALDEAIEELRICPELAEKNWYEIEFKKHSHQQGCTSKADDDCPVGSTAEGLSVKAAYNLQQKWKHLASKSYIGDEDSDKLRIVGVARDLQANTIVERDFVVPKVIRYRNGDVKKLSESELVKVVGAGTSKAIRNAILNSIPDYFKKKYWDECRKVDDEYQVQKAGGKEQAAQITMGDLKKLGVTKEMVEKKLGHPVKAMTDEGRMKLRGWYNAITSGESKVEEIFGAAAETHETTVGQATTATATATEEPMEHRKPAPPAEEPPPPTDPTPASPKRRAW